MTYKLLNCPISGEPTCVMLELPGRLLTIPFAEGNTDYQEYLAWLAEGNEPLPADPVE